MKKIRAYLLEIVLAIVLFSLLLLLVLPYFSGYKIQSDYEALLLSISKKTNLSYEIVSFQRHWFKSDAKLVVKDANHQTVLIFDHEIVHGPLFLGLVLKGRSPFVNMVIAGDVAIDGAYTGLYSGFLKITKTFKVNAYMGFSNDIDIKTILPAIEDEIDGVRYKTGNIKINLQYSASKNSVNGEVEVPAFSRYDHSLVEIDRLILSFDENLSGGYSGDIILSFNSLKLRYKQEMFDFKKVSARIKNTYRNNLLDSSLDINISKLNLFNEQVNSFSFGLLAEKVNLVNYDNLFAFNKVNENELGNVYDFRKYNYALLKVEPFSFFTEHGEFSANMQIKSVDDNLKHNDGYLYNKDLTLDAVLSINLFRRIYELVASYSSNSMNTFSVFTNSMIKLNYLDKNLDKLNLRVSGKGGNLIINDHDVDYDGLTNKLLSNAFPN